MNVNCEKGVFAMKYVLYNPKAGQGVTAESVNMSNFDESISYLNVTEIDNYADWFASIEPDADIILCGGDGTLNRFVNATKDIKFENKFYLYPVGSGNDFIRELGINKEQAASFCIDDYVKNLPTVTVNGEDHLFINGVGYGIDGYCCEEGDKLKASSDKAVNYTAIAIKGLLFHYKPTNAKITVDGNEYEFKNVWLAPTMNGKYYGGGMIPAPEQKRLDEDKKLSVMVFCGKSKLKTLMIFPSLFKGEHVKHKKAVSVLSGKEIKVEYDRPTPLQIDGETILGVTSYTARV